jgi:pimeloyl-ACP methyl ester carboxylesterase
MACVGWHLDDEGPGVRDWGERDPRWRGIRSETIEVPHGHGPGATTVHLLRAGEPRDDATPTVLLHGLGGTATNWLEVMADLALDGEVVAPDLPGFGQTEPPDPRAARLRPQVRFLVRLLAELGWSRARVHGNSMGGMLAVLLAAEAPRQVEHLVLTSPALPPPRRPGSLSPMAAARFVPFVSSWTGALAMQRLYDRKDAEWIRRRTMELVMGEAGDVRPAMREVQIDNILFAQQARWRSAAFAQAATDTVATLGVGRALHRAVEAALAPTLIIWGELDRLVPRSAMDTAVRRRPDWDRVDLERVGHVAMLEVPDRWLEVVRDWQARA